MNMQFAYPTHFYDFWERLCCPMHLLIKDAGPRLIIQMAISRSREFAADRDGARICGNPQALASALNRLQHGAEQIPMQANQATAHMFIVNPFTGMAGGFKSLFSTHPPTRRAGGCLIAHGSCS